MIFLSNLLIVIGICNLGIVFIGIITLKNIELSQSSFANSQGTDIVQLLYVFILRFIGTNKTFIIMGIIGFIGVTNYNMILGKIGKQYSKEKYNLIRNFSVNQ